MIKMELHVHTKYSKDSLLCFWPLYLKCLLCGIKIIAITEHNNIEGAIKFREFCKKRGDKIQVVIGEEIFTNSGEIIGLFLTSEIPKGLSAEETIKEIERQNGVVYIPHPYDEKRSKTVLKEHIIDEYKDRINCIEIHNGRNISEKYDCIQKKIANKYGIKPVIGSDAHTFIEVGRNVVLVKAQIIDNKEKFIDALDSMVFIPKKCIGFAHIVTKFAKAVKLVHGGNINEIYNIIVRRFKKNSNIRGKEN